jgi:hypothetical protein
VLVMVFPSASQDGTLFNAGAGTGGARLAVATGGSSIQLTWVANTVAGGDTKLVETGITTFDKIAGVLVTNWTAAGQTSWFKRPGKPVVTWTEALAIISPTDFSVNLGAAGTIGIELAAISSGILNATQARSLLENPWQIAAPLERNSRARSLSSIFNVSSLESFSATDSPSAALTLSSDIAESITITATESAVNSVTRPNSDVTTTGWTATPGPDLFDMIDEVTASDTDYITSPDLTSGASTTIHGLTQSLAVGTYTVRFRSEKATAPTRSVRIHLMDGTSTIVGSSGWQAVTASYALYEVSITTSALATRVGIEAQ